MSRSTNKPQIKCTDLSSFTPYKARAHLYPQSSIPFHSIPIPIAATHLLSAGAAAQATQALVLPSSACAQERTEIVARFSLGGGIVGSRMLAIFQKQVAHAPQELNSPRSSAAKPKNPDEILRDFHAAHPTDAFSTSFGGGAAVACVGAHARGLSGYQRMFCGVDDIYCVFLGSLDNLSSLIRQYGLCSRSTNEALLVIEAYRTLRDRGPYPADQVVKDLSGPFAFVVFDNKSGAVFAALSTDGDVPLYWGIAADGSVVICDDRAIVKAGCGKSYAPFPVGCMFHSEGGLKSFEHPMNRLKAMPRVDSEGVMCGATFKVDTFTKINSMPRVGSATNWAAWDDAV